MRVLLALPAPVHAALALTLGLVVGSFLNVVIHRLPRGASLLRPGSHCPHCARPVAPLENIP
ncbi:MAG: prepilin peptidase, partial [Myxococcota bacterium]